MATHASEPPRTPRTPKRSFYGLKQRLGDAGIHGGLVERLVPSWWTKDDRADLLPEFEFTVARILSMPIEKVRDPKEPLAIPLSAASLRAPKSTTPDEMKAAIHIATKVAGAVVRNLSPGYPSFTPLPSARELRDEMVEPPTFRTLLGALWEKWGVPVISVESLPAPKFKALACWTEGRPVIVIGKQDAEHPAALTNLAHEVGHVACGHVAEGMAVVEDDSDSEDSTPMEREAWAYYRELLFGNAGPGVLPLARYEVSETTVQLVVRETSISYRIDQGTLVYHWANSHRTPEHYRLRRKLLQSLGVQQGAQNEIRQLTSRFVSTEDCSEFDAALIGLCI